MEFLSMILNKKIVDNKLLVEVGKRRRRERFCIFTLPNQDASLFPTLAKVFLQDV